MKFSKIVKEAIMLLQDAGRVSYRALKVEFDLDDEQLDRFCQVIETKHDTHAV